eukprot:982152-Prorocentrum_minimum.AAC.1
MYYVIILTSGLVICAKVTDEGVGALSGLTALTSLGLRDCSNVTEMGASKLYSQIASSNSSSSAERRPSISLATGDVGMSPATATAHQHDG